MSIIRIQNALTSKRNRQTERLELFLALVGEYRELSSYQNVRTRMTGHNRFDILLTGVKVISLELTSSHVTLSHSGTVETIETEEQGSRRIACVVADALACNGIYVLEKRT